MSTIDGLTIEEVNFAYFLDNLEKQAKKASKKERIAELVGKGIDKQTARDMVRFGLA